MKNVPNFLLIGPGRTGTTWTTKNLMLHPQIFLPRRKSTRFFMDNYDRGWPWYESHFKRRSELAIGEASVGYFADPQAAKLIHQHMPDIKMIATFRDPVDRAYSEMGHLRALARKGDPNLDIDFEEKLRITPRLVDQGKYAKHLEHYLSLFPRENILILFYHYMKENPHEFLRQIYTFLGVDSSFISPLLHQEINASATRLAESKLKKLMYRVLLRFDLFTLSQRVDASMRKRIDPLQPEVRQRLLSEHYIDDIEKLESMLHMDLTSWKDPAKKGRD